MTLALEGGVCSAARPGRTLPPGKTWYHLICFQVTAHMLVNGCFSNVSAVLLVKYAYFVLYWIHDTIQIEKNCLLLSFWIQNDTNIVQF